MATTVQQLIDAALRLNGVLGAAGRSANTAEYTNSLLALNQLLGNLSAEQLFLYQLTEEKFTLTGASSYTMGTGATFNSVRPVRIRSAAVIATNNAAMGVEVVSADKFSELVYDRSLTGLFAKILTCDYAWPSANIFLWPTPSGGQLELFSYKPIASFVALTDNVSFPAGYEDAIRYLLAVELAREFPRAVVTPEIHGRAQQAKATLRELNSSIFGPELPPSPEQPKAAKGANQ